jgi:hypothetical protein
MFDLVSKIIDKIYTIVLRRKFFSQNINQPKLIYFYFLDQNIVKHLDKVFKDLFY